MRLNRTMYIGVLLSGLIAGCATTHSVYPADSRRGRLARGVHYSLPRTDLVVETPIKLQFYKPGKYARYAKPMLNLDVDQASKRSYSVGEPKISTLSGPDPEEVYVVEIAGGLLEQRELLLELTEAGLMTSATTTVEDKTVPLVVETLKVAAEIAGKAVAPKGPPKSPPKSPMESLTDLAVPAPPTIRRHVVPQQLWKLYSARRRLADSRAFWSAIDEDGELGAANEVRARLEELVGRKGKRLLTLEEYGVLNRAISRIGDEKVSKHYERAVKDNVQLIVHLEHPSSVREAAKHVEELLTEVYDGNRKYVEELVGRIAKKVDVKEVAEVTTTDKNRRPTSILIITPPGTKVLIEHFESLDASILAEHIRSLQTKREDYLLQRGDSTHHGEGTSVALAALAKREQELLHPFVGTRKEATWVARFKVELPPDAPSSGKTWELCRLDEKRGVFILGTRGVLQIGSVAPMFVVDKLVADEQPFTVEVAVTSDPSKQMVDKISSALSRRDENARAQGFYYRVPATGIVEVCGWHKRGAKRRLARAAVFIPQYGKVCALPRSTGSALKSSYALQVYATTGGLKKITVKGSALPAGSVAGVGEAVTIVQGAAGVRSDAKREEREAQDAAALRQERRIAELKAQRDVLTLEEEIRALKSKMPE